MVENRKVRGGGLCRFSKFSKSVVGLSYVGGFTFPGRSGSQRVGPHCGTSPPPPEQPPVIASKFCPSPGKLPKKFSLWDSTPPPGHLKKLKNRYTPKTCKNITFNFAPTPGDVAKKKLGKKVKSYKFVIKFNIPSYNPFLLRYSS